MDVSDIDRGYQGRLEVNMFADYYWMVRREIDNEKREHVWSSIKDKKKGFHKKNSHVVLNIS